MDILNSQTFTQVTNKGENNVYNRTNAVGINYRRVVRSYSIPTN